MGAEERHHSEGRLGERARGFRGFRGLGDGWIDSRAGRHEQQGADLQLTRTVEQSRGLS